MERLLTEVCKIQYGFPFDSSKFSDKNGLPVIRIRDVVRGYSETFTTEEYNEEYIVNDGDMLIGMDGEFNIGKWNGGKALLNQRVCRLFPTSEIDSEYLFYYMPKILKEIEYATPFATVKHLSAKQINKIVVPFPSSTEALKMLNASILEISRKIDNIINAVANTGSSALLSTLTDLESERERLCAEVEKIEKQSKTHVITETMVELAYAHARGLLRSGDKELHRQLINLYLDRVIVYYDHIEFYLNTLPADILKDEINRSLGIGEKETLVDYIIKNEPTIADAIYNEKLKQKKGTTSQDSPENYIKKADNPLKISELSTFVGGGEGNRTPVRKPIRGAFSERSLSLEFPARYAERQALRAGSFISSWKGSKLCPTHVHR